MKRDYLSVDDLTQDELIASSTSPPR